MDLSEAEREELIALIRAGRPLPARFRASLFEDAAATELIWPGKTSEVERVVLPFQSIEQIDEPRTETLSQPDLFSVDSHSGRQAGGWTNKLIWGDNKLILSSLAHGPLRQSIEDAGGLKFVYIDPPFDVGADFSVEVEFGDAAVTKQPSVVEEVAYRDTWGKGADSFLGMLSERLRLIHALLHPEGWLAIHVDWRLNYLVRALLEEVFGGAGYWRNEISWRRDPGGKGNKARTRQFPRNVDTIYLYTKSSSDWFFEQIRVPLTSDQQATYRYTDENGRKFKAVDARNYSAAAIARMESEGLIYVSNRGQKYKKYFMDEAQGVVDSIWTDIPGFGVRTASSEITGYPTQKPEALIHRLVRATTSEGDLMADFFCGSGTTLAVAEKLSRKWIGADLGRFAIHTSRKRLIDVQRQLRSEGKPYRAFEILNLGRYERQYFVGVDMTGSEEERRADSDRRRDQFIDLILSAYGAQRSEQLPPFHGVAGRAAVFVGPLEAPVTETDVRAVIEAARSAGLARADVLGFEFEMGIKPAMADEARDLGVTLALRQIPNEVFDKRAVASKQVQFHDVGYVEVDVKSSRGRAVTVALSDFSVFYAQEDADAAAAALRSGGSKVVIDGGQVVRVSKDRKGIAFREVLTKKWSDWIDYWAVDFDFESQPELITVVEDGHEEQVRTGRFVFENEWQSFRTRRDRELELSTPPHTYNSPGIYKIAVKVIDVFGNDTTKVVPVRVR